MGSSDAKPAEVWRIDARRVSRVLEITFSSCLVLPPAQILAQRAPLSRLMSSNWAALQAKLGGGGGGRGGGSRGAGGGRGGGGWRQRQKQQKQQQQLQNLLRKARAAAAARRAAALCGAGRAAAPRAGRPPLRRGGGAVLPRFVCQRATSSNALPSSLTDRVAASLERLRAQRLFRHDIVWRAARRLGADADGGVAHPRRRARRHLQVSGLRTLRTRGSRRRAARRAPARCARSTTRSSRTRSG